MRRAPGCRAEGLPLLVEKFECKRARRYASKRRQQIREACADHDRLERMAVHEFMSLLAWP